MIPSVLTDILTLLADIGQYWPYWLILAVQGGLRLAEIQNEKIGVPTPPRIFSAASLNSADILL